MKRDKLEQLIPLSIILAGILIVLVIASYIGWFYWEHNSPLSVSTSTWGAFGDFFGGILNPLIALIAAFWLTQSILIQQKELHDTNETLKLSSETQAKKRFEDTFFSLLDQHNNLLKELNHKYYEQNNKLKPSIIEEIKPALFHPDNKTVREARAIFHSKYNGACGHYFRVLYQLLKFIATHSPEAELNESFNAELLESTTASQTEKLYSNIVRSFISFDVAQILAINCAAPDEHDTYYKYKLLIERYSFLEHMPPPIGLRNELLAIYAKKAFGNNRHFTR